MYELHCIVIKINVTYNMYVRSSTHTAQESVGLPVLFSVVLSCMLFARRVCPIDNVYQQGNFFPDSPQLVWLPKELGSARSSFHQVETLAAIVM